MRHTCVRTLVRPVSFLATKRTSSPGRVFCLGQSVQHKEYRAPVQRPLAVSHTRRRSPGCHGARDRLSTPSSFVSGGVFETPRLSHTNQPVSESSSRNCLRPGNGYLIIRWSADGTQGTCAPWLPHRLNLSDGNLTKWVCHVSPAGPIFPFKVIGLEGFRPPSPSPIQSWLCLEESVGTVVCHQGEL